MEPEMVRRARAVEATERRFSGRVFQWGKVDCARLAAFHLRQVGWKLPKVPFYRDEAGAMRALEALGAKTLADVADSIGLPRIAPASAVLGDLMFMPGSSRAGAMVIAVGNGAIKGFHEAHEGLVTMRPDLVIAAWRIMA